MSDRTIAVRLKAEFADFNSQIDQAAAKADKMGQALEASSRKVEAALQREREAAAQVAAAQKNLARVQESGAASSKQLGKAHAEVAKAEKAHEGATESLTAAQKAHEQQAQRATTTLGRMAQSAQQNSQAWNTAAGVLIAAGGAVTALGAAALRTGIQYNAMQQSSRAALRTLLGSAEAANAQMDRLDAFARTSPFAKTAFISAQQQMLAFGVEAKKVVPYLSALNDAVASAGGSSQQLGELAFVMAQISAAGKITGQDLIQLGQRGVNAAELIGSQMGKTGAEIRAQITAGTLDANDALDALAGGMSERYAGAAANVKETWEGATDRVRAAWRDLAAELAQPLVGRDGGGALVEAANQAANLMRAFQALPGPVKAGVAALGGVAGVGALAAGSLMALAPRIVSTMEAFATLSSQSTKFATAMRIGKAGAVAFTGALTAGLVALGAWSAASAAAAAQSKEFGATLEVIDGKAVRTEATWRKFSEVLQENRSASLGFMGVGKSVSETLDLIGASAQDAQGWVNGSAESIARINQLREEWAAGFEGHDFFGFNDEAVKYLPMALDNIAKNMTSAERNALSLAAANESLGVSAEGAADPAQAHAAAMQAEADAASAAAAQVRALEAALWGQANALLKLQGDEIGWQQTLSDTAEVFAKNAGAVAKNRGELSLNTQAGRDNARALQEIATAGMRQVDGMIEGGAAASAIAAKMSELRSSYIAGAQAAGHSAKEAAKLADSLGLIPSRVVTELASSGVREAEGDVNDLLAAIKHLPAKTQTDVISKFLDGGINAAHAALGRIDGKTATTYINTVHRTTKYTKNVMVARASGGAVFGAGTETSDSIPALLSNNEHVWSAREVRGAGGHAAVERLRARARTGSLQALAEGGAVLRFAAGGAAKKKKTDELKRELARDLRRGELFDSMVEGSGLSVIDDMLRWGQDANLSSSKRKKLTSLADSQEATVIALAERLKSAQDAVQRLESISQTVQSALGKFELGGALAGGAWARHTDAAGNVWYTGGGAASASSIATQAQARAGQVRAFAEKLQKLQRAGLSGVVLSEIAALGTDEGGRVADAFLTDLGQVSNINAAYADIAKFSGQAAQYVTEGYEAGGLAAAKAMVESVKTEATAIGTTLAEGFAAALGYKLSDDGKSLKKKASGGPVTAGSLYQVGELGPELFRPNVSGRIIPAGQSARMQQSQPTTIVHFAPTYNYPVGVPTAVQQKDDLMRAVSLGAA